MLSLHLFLPLCNTCPCLQPSQIVAFHILQPISAPSSLPSLLFFFSTIPVLWNEWVTWFQFSSSRPLCGLSFNGRVGTHAYTCWVCRQQLLILHSYYAQYHAERYHTYIKTKSIPLAYFSVQPNYERQLCERESAPQITLPAEDGGWKKETWKTRINGNKKKNEKSSSAEIITPHHLIKDQQKFNLI